MNVKTLWVAILFTMYSINCWAVTADIVGSNGHVSILSREIHIFCFILGFACIFFSAYNYKFGKRKSKRWSPTLLWSVLIIGILALCMGIWWLIKMPGL